MQPRRRPAPSPPASSIRASAPGGVAQLAAGTELNGIAAISDGSAIAAGIAGGNMIAAKLTSGGQLAGGFGTGGIATAVAGGVARAVAIQPDGKIVLAGDNCSGFGSVCSSGGLLVARLNADGSLDSSFGSGGAESIIDLPAAFEMHGRSVAIAPGGQIVIGGDQPSGGFPHMVVVRLNSNGSLDSSFGSGGIAHADLGEDSTAKGIEVQPNGKVLIGGSSGPGRASGRERLRRAAQQRRHVRLDVRRHLDAAWRQHPRASTGTSIP